MKMNHTIAMNRLFTMALPILLVAWGCATGTDGTGRQADRPSEEDGRTDMSGAAPETAAAVDAPEDILAALAACEERLPALLDALTDAQTRGLDVSYPRNDLTVANMFIEFGREDITEGRITRAAEVASEVEMLLDRAAAEMNQNRPAPRLADGPIVVRDGSFWATADTPDGPVHQPVFLTGYGHFGRVIEDIPLLAEMGINFIQFELGPAAALNPDGTETGLIEEYVVHALDRAHEHGVRVDLLLSPHQNMPWWHEHFPEAWLDEWPYISHVPFIKWSVDAPQVRDFIERHLRVMISRIKDHPALHSVCLTNEPDYRLGPQDPWRMPQWTAYLRETHGDIAALNAAYGTSYRDFEEVEHPTFGPAWYREHPLYGPDVDNKAWLYDGIRFNQTAFAGWHAWMRDIIHEIAPDLPVHAKVMPVVWGRYTLYWGTDPYEFAQLSQLNGNDCYFEPTPRHAPWQSTWQVQNKYYDLQRAMKRTPVINTENHIIPDRFQGYVSPDHIYTAIWQGAVHGQGASATWCWERTYDETSDFEGLILHRAACTAEMGRVAMDLMRLAPEMAAMQNIEPEVAILWSNAAQVHDRRFFRQLYRLYEALNFCGLPIGFVTEEQVQAEGTGDYACILVTGARTVHREALDVLRDFQRQGGRIIGYGEENLIKDQYGRPITPLVPDAVIPVTLSDQPLRDQLFLELSEAGVMPDVTIHDTDGSVQYGVEWRSAQHGDTSLLNLVNLTRHEAAVLLPDGVWHDLIRDVETTSPLVLQTNQPHLLRRVE